MTTLRELTLTKDFFALILRRVELLYLMFQKQRFGVSEGRFCLPLLKRVIAYIFYLTKLILLIRIPRSRSKGGTDLWQACQT